MPTLEGVLFDFGDTLFGRRGAHRAIVEAAANLGAQVDDTSARRLWAEIQARARTPDELAKGRDLSPEAHRACWTALYSRLDDVAAGLGEALYEREVDPLGWAPFPDTEEALSGLFSAGVPVGVVSDTGWDIRPVFAAHGLDQLVDVFSLSCEHGVAKPAPRLFEAACEELDLEPAATLMVGDNPLTDGGAVEAGLTAYILPPAADSHERGLGAVLTLMGVAP
ncbi:MAG TPA: HAD family hydrolase [Acidimicrobiales bacterium]|nr:HAD family hydrolase [Acidimicrobiales bacterium]